MVGSVYELRRHKSFSGVSKPAFTKASKFQEKYLDRDSNNTAVFVMYCISCQGGMQAGPKTAAHMARFSPPVDIIAAPCSPRSQVLQMNSFSIP